MDEADYRLYLCSSCFRRFFWSELSRQEHCCLHCRLPLQSCAICDRKFEPRDESEVYCKRCDFHLVRHVSSRTPPPVLDLVLDADADEDVESETVETPRALSMTQRWEEIKTATGIEDGYIMD